MFDLAQLEILTAAIVLAVFWMLETAIPFLSNRRHRFRHAARNIFIGAFNAILLAVLFAPVLVGVIQWSENHSFGLLQLAGLPTGAAGCAAILLLDAWMYVWHRANHRISFLWRFHKVHHSDPEMDVSTAVRFHTGEILISAALRLIVIALLGLSLWQVLLYDLLTLPFILFHHSNVRFPEKFDKFYRAVFASPAMHRIHHSPERTETDSNFGTVFSFWDRLARSFRLRESTAKVKYGLDELDAAESESLAKLALMPFDRQEKSKLLQSFSLK